MASKDGEASPLDLSAALKTVASVIAASSSVPSSLGGEWDLYASFADFRSVLAREHADAGRLLERLLGWNGIRKSFPCDAKDLAELVTEANDALLERVSTALDEAAGLRKNEEPVLLEVSTSKHASASSSGGPSGRWKTSPDDGDQIAAKLVTARSVRRPQLAFSDAIDNSKKAFVPKINEKPHSKKPLSVLPEYDEEDRVISYTHPYQVELDTFRPTDQQLRVPAGGDVERPLALDEASFAFVETPEALARMTDMLKKEDVIAVDLEAHWFRSFLVSLSSDLFS